MAEGETLTINTGTITRSRDVARAAVDGLVDDYINAVARQENSSDWPGERAKRAGTSLCTHETFTKGRSIFSRSTENGPAFPQSSRVHRRSASPLSGPVVLSMIPAARDCRFLPTNRGSRASQGPTHSGSLLASVKAARRPSSW